MAELTEITPKMKAAVELLERGLQLYFEQAYFAAIHLAGGADAILGVYVTRTGQESAFTSLQAGAMGIAEIIGGEGEPATLKGIGHAMNYARNRIKHLNDEGDDEIAFTPEAEAADLLRRALTNYHQLASILPLEETELMRRFNQRDIWTKHYLHTHEFNSGKIMVNRDNAAYCLMNTGLTQTAILSPTLKPGEKRKVNVRNTAAPFDELVVLGWIESNESGKFFVFEDGNLGHNVTLSFDVAKRLVLEDK
jgi:hypothetical protein